MKDINGKELKFLSLEKDKNGGMSSKVVKKIANLAIFIKQEVMLLKMKMAVKVFI